MNPLQAAVDYLRRGDWQAAHRIVQDMEAPLAYWIHAVVHRVEGDLDNARYWYTRAQRTFEPNLSVSDELDKILGEVQ